MFRDHPQAVAVDVDFVPQLPTHPVLDVLALAHRDSRRDEGPRCRFISVRPVHGPKPEELLLQPGDHAIALPHRRPIAAVDVEAEDASDLVLYAIDIGIAVDSS